MATRDGQTRHCMPAAMYASLDHQVVKIHNAIQGCAATVSDVYCRNRFSRIQDGDCDGSKFRQIYLNAAR
jgi:hypothetical protein